MTNSQVQADGDSSPASVDARSLVMVGLMSGTSLDGISAAVVRFTENNARIAAQLLAFEQMHYNRDQRTRLERAMQSGTAQEYCRLNVDVGEWLATAAKSALNQSSVPRSEVSVIVSHGQTLWHEPGHSTWQIGDAATIAERTSCHVISDLRSRDVAAGGQGAPLVPMADVTLFSDEHHWRALQNLGGIGNVTVVAPSSSPNAMDGARAFDTGPGVVLIDAVFRKVCTDNTAPVLQEHGLRVYDVDGMMAKLGQVDHEVVREMLRHPYFASEPPKSTGRELFSAEFVDQYLAMFESRGREPLDALRTAVEFTAVSIADQYRRFLPEPIADVVLSGGGARNPVLVEAITKALAPTPVRLFSDLFFDGEAKEAVAFALLGYLHLTGRPGNVPRATGARGPRQLGVLTSA